MYGPDYGKYQIRLSGAGFGRRLASKLQDLELACYLVEMEEDLNDA
jgi:hypothetical protein